MPRAMELFAGSEDLTGLGRVDCPAGGDGGVDIPPSFFGAGLLAKEPDGCEHGQVGFREPFLVCEFAEAVRYLGAAAGRSLRPIKSDIVTPSALRLHRACPPRGVAHPGRFRGSTGSPC